MRPVSGLQSSQARLLARMHENVQLPVNGQWSSRLALAAGAKMQIVHAKFTVFIKKLLFVNTIVQLCGLQIARVWRRRCVSLGRDRVVINGTAHPSGLCSKRVFGRRLWKLRSTKTEMLTWLTSLSRQLRLSTALSLGFFQRQKKILSTPETYLSCSGQFVSLLIASAINYWCQMSDRAHQKRRQGKFAVGIIGCAPYRVTRSG